MPIDRTIAEKLAQPVVTAIKQWHETPSDRTRQLLETELLTAIRLAYSQGALDATEPKQQP